MNIFIVRHGESDTNIGGRFATFTNGDLTEFGKQQARHARKSLEDIEFDKVYASTLIRAIKTAEIVGDTKKVYEYEEISEIDGGDHENKTWEEINKVHDKFHIKLINELSHMEIPGGESFQDVKERLESFIDKTLNSGKFNEDSNVLIVSHGVTLRILITMLLDEDDDWVNTTHWSDNTAITHIEIRENKEPKLHKLMSNKHLIKGGMDRSDYENWSGKEFIKGVYNE